MPMSEVKNAVWDWVEIHSDMKMLLGSGFGSAGIVCYVDMISPWDA